MKKFLSLLLGAVLTLGLFSACTPAETPNTDTQSAEVSSTAPSTDKTTDTENKNTSSDKKEPVVTVEKNKMPTEETNMFLVCEQVKSQVIVYDIESYNGENLDDNVVWNFRPVGKGSITKGIAGAKYRSDTVFGDVVIMCAGGGYASIVTYPEKKELWYVENCGNNAHSVELLPDGNMLVASSTGATVRLYHTSALVKDPNAKVDKGVDYELPGAHGLLWDPKYDCLWAIGDYELACYKVEGTGTSAQLVKDNTRTKKLPDNWGHDLSADFTDEDYLWLTTGANVYHFNKTNGEFEKSYPNHTFLSNASTKGFGNNRNGNFFYCMPNGGPNRTWNRLNIAEWCTDTINYAYTNEAGKTVWKSCVSERNAFYKVVTFYGKYQ